MLFLKKSATDPTPLLKDVFSLTKDQIKVYLNTIEKGEWKTLSDIGT